MRRVARDAALVDAAHTAVPRMADPEAAVSSRGHYRGTANTRLRSGRNSSPFHEAHAVESHERSVRHQPQIPFAILGDRPDVAAGQAVLLRPRDIEVPGCL